MMGPHQTVAEQVKVVGDIGAGAITISVIMQWAPPVAALCTALYTIFRLYEAIDNHIHNKRTRNNKE